MSSGQIPSQGQRRKSKSAFPVWEKDEISRIVGLCATLTEQSLKHVVEILNKMEGGSIETASTPAKPPRVTTEKSEKPAAAGQQAKAPVTRVWDRGDLDELPAAVWLRENNTKEARTTPEGKSHLSDLSAAIALLNRIRLTPTERTLPGPDTIWRRTERAYRSNDYFVPYGQIIPKGCDDELVEELLTIIFTEESIAEEESTKKKKKSQKRARVGDTSSEVTAVNSSDSGA